MWIIRFHLIKPAHYNLVARYCKKQWFFPRRIPSIIFVKSFISHVLEKKSWRTISSQYNLHHIQLYNFYIKHKNNQDFQKILHTFAKARIIVFIEEKNQFNNHELDNSSELLKLTLKELDIILGDINS